MHLLRSAILLLAATALAAAEAEPGLQTVRLLAIGNSFSQNVLNQLPALARSGGRTLEFEHCMFGGARLEQHWARVEASEKDPVDPKTLYAGKQTLRQALSKRAWDVVTIQQYSFISHDPATYRPYADRLVAEIRGRAPQATVLMHMTWAYRRDDPRFAATAQDLETEANRAETTGIDRSALPPMRTAEDMHRLVASAYRTTAADLHLGIIPVGDAFAAVDADPAWGFRADPAWNPRTAVFPALPDQSRSLHVGWMWRKQKPAKAPAEAEPVQTLGFDGHHAGKAGEYLGACVWYAVLFRASPVGLDYRPEGMPADQARFLQETAQRVAAAEPPAR